MKKKLKDMLVGDKFRADTRIVSTLYVDRLALLGRDEIGRNYLYTHTHSLDCEYEIIEPEPECHISTIIEAAGKIDNIPDMKDATEYMKAMLELIESKEEIEWLYECIDNSNLGYKVSEFATSNVIDKNHSYTKIPNGRKMHPETFEIVD